MTNTDVHAITELPDTPDSPSSNKDLSISKFHDAKMFFEKWNEVDKGEYDQDDNEKWHDTQ